MNFMTDVLQPNCSRDGTLDEFEDTIASRFERQVTAVPDKLAIVTDETSLTYRALDLKASRVAAALSSLPSQRDRPIVLFVKDEAARVAAMLGALKANRIFVPLGANSPEQWVSSGHRRLRSRADRCRQSYPLDCRAGGRWQRHCCRGRSAWPIA